MIVGLTSPGQMGTGLGSVLVRHGATVLVDLQGRSAASRERALQAGLTPLNGEAGLAGADVLLSVSPPGLAVELAERLAPILALADKAPLYVDANAIAPDTARHIGGVMAAAGVPFCDGGIIGLPPGTAARDPTLFMSGPRAEAAERLAAFGLQVKWLDDRIGSASALKMSYAGITKGLVALGAAMIGNAEREGVGAALAAELGASQAHLLAGFRRSIPDMFAKSGRWVAEMHAIADTCADDAPSAGVYRHFAEVYQAIAAAYQRGATDRDSPVAVLERFLRESVPPTS